MKRSLLVLFMVLPVCVLSQAANINYIVYGTSVDNIDGIVSAEVVFFIPIADSNNFADTSFRTVLLQNPDVGDSTIVPLVSPLKDSVDIGAIVIKTGIVNFVPGLSKAQKRSAIDDVFNSRKAAFIKTFYAKNDFWGLERIVP